MFRLAKEDRVRLFILSRSIYCLFERVYERLNFVFYGFGKELLDNRH